jgi:hypothetical protein
MSTWKSLASAVTGTALGGPLAGAALWEIAGIVLGAENAREQAIANKDRLLADAICSTKL